jgi:hypothetical protein
MGLQDNKIVQYIRPESVTDPAAFAWEYLLVWQSPDGGVYQWLFLDYVLKMEISGSIINTKTENINKLFSGAVETIELAAEDLTENEFDTISDILRAKIVTRVFADGTIEKLAIITDGFEKRKSDARYKLIIEVQPIEKPILK